METQTLLWYHNGQKQDKEYCVEEGIGTYDMWYGEVCKDVMSSFIVGLSEICFHNRSSSLELELDPSPH